METRQETQLSVVRAHLLSGKSITPIDALRMCGCFRLSAIIYILRHEEGLPIITTQPEACYGKPYALYFIDHNYFAKKWASARRIATARVVIHVTILYTIASAAKYAE